MDKIAIGDLPIGATFRCSMDLHYDLFINCVKTGAIRSSDGRIGSTIFASEDEDQFRTGTTCWLHKEALVTPVTMDIYAGDEFVQRTLPT